MITVFTTCPACGQILHEHKLAFPVVLLPRPYADQFAEQLLGILLKHRDVCPREMTPETEDKGAEKNGQDGAGISTEDGGQPG